MISLIDSFINNVDQLIAYEQGSIFRKGILTKNYYISGSARFFFVGKTIVKSIAPGQGTILGYPLLNNVFNLIYNYCFKMEQESPFILNHNFKIFGNYYTFLLDKFYIKTNSSISISENDYIVSVSVIGSNIIYDFKSLITLSNEGWFDFLNNSGYLNIIMNFNNYPFYDQFFHRFENRRFIKISAFNFTTFFYYFYSAEIDQLISFKVEDVYNNLNFIYRLENEFLKIINLKNYFFMKSRINILINNFNDLEKNEINFNLIFKFITILYKSSDFSYIHFYINLFNIENIKEDSSKIFEYLNLFIRYRLILCENALKDRNKIFIEALKNIDLLDPNKTTSTQIVLDFLEEFDTSQGNFEESERAKEYFLLKILELAVNNFRHIEYENEYYQNEYENEYQD